MTLEGFAETFLIFTAQRCKPATVAEYRRILRLWLLPRFAARDLRHISTADAARLHADMHGTPVQANRTAAALARILKVARIHGLKTQAVEKPPLYREVPRTRFLSPDECGRLLARLDAEPAISAKAITLMLLTAMRRSEVLNLRWSEVDLGARLVTLEDTKTGRSVRPLPREAAQLLASIPRVSEFVFPGRGATGRMVFVSRVWNRLRADLGLQDVCLHSLRHTRASQLVAAGVPLFTVSRVLGHSTTRMTERYAHLQPSHLVEAVDRVKL